MHLKGIDGEIEVNGTSVEIRRPRRGIFESRPKTLSIALKHVREIKWKQAGFFTGYLEIVPFDQFTDEPEPTEFRASYQLYVVKFTKRASSEAAATATLIENLISQA